MSKRTKCSAEIESVFFPEESISISTYLSSPIEDINYNVTKYAMHNSFVLLGSKTNLSLIETKLLRLIISNVQILPDRDRFPTYRISLPELAKKLNINKRALRNEIDEITDNLLKSTIFIKYQNGTNKVQKYNLFSIAEFDDAHLEVKMNNDIKDLFLKLQGNFTVYEQLNLIMTYRSKHSIALLEALYATIKRVLKTRLKFDAGETVKVDFSDDELRWFTSTSDKYKETYDLKKRVIDTAVNEINSASELYIEDYKVEKRGVARSSNHFIFYVYNKNARDISKVTHVEIQNIFARGKLSEAFIIQQLNCGGHPYHPDQIKELLKYYNTIEDFIEDFNIAYKNSKYNIVSYMIKMGENRVKMNKWIKNDPENKNWDTDELKKNFEDIVEYWNSTIISIDIERPEDSFNGEEFYNLKPIEYTDIRHRKHYYNLLTQGQTQELIKKAIDIAARSSYFLRTSGNFTRFINPKNFFDIASGEMDYDSHQVKIWKSELPTA